MTDFNELSKVWDSEANIVRAEAIVSKLKTVMRHEPGQTALELGCGTGLIGFGLHDRFKELIMLDPSEGMVEVARTKVEERQLKDVTVLKGTLDAYPAYRGLLDAVFTCMVLHHVPDVSQTVEDVYKVLSPGAQFTVVEKVGEDDGFHDEDAHVHGILPEDLKATLESAGFQNIRYDVFYEGIKEKDGTSVPYQLFVMTADKSKSLCPICGKPNGCHMAQGAPADTCWCMETPIPETLLSEIPEAHRGKACVCRTCVETHHSKK